MAKRMIDDKAVALARRLKRYFAIGNAAPSGWKDADPEEIAAAIAFLADEKAAFITGQTLFVDGGASLGRL